MLWINSRISFSLPICTGTSRYSEVWQSIADKMLIDSSWKATISKTSLSIFLYSVSSLFILAPSFPNYSASRCCITNYTLNARFYKLTYYLQLKLVLKFKTIKVLVVDLLEGYYTICTLYQSFATLFSIWSLALFQATPVLNPVS